MSKQLYVFLEDGDLIMDGDVFVKWDGEDFQWGPTLLVGEHWCQGMNPVIRKVGSVSTPEEPAKKEQKIGDILLGAIKEIKSRFGVSIAKVEFVNYQDFNGAYTTVAVGDVRVEVTL